MDSDGKAIQKHYRFPFFSLLREFRDIIYQNLFVTKTFVNLRILCDFEDGTCETLKTIYEATTNLQFLRKSLETFSNFTIDVVFLPYLHKYGSLSLQMKEQFGIPPSRPDIAIEMTTTSTLGQRLVKYIAATRFWFTGEDKGIECFVTDEEEDLL